MADEKDFLLHMIQEQWAQARQSENQRATLSNFIIVIASAITAFLVKIKPGKEGISLSIFLIFLGAFGALICAKLYERFYLHVQRIGRMMERLDQLFPNAQVCHLEEIADKRHKKRFRITSKIRIHCLWMIIHITIMVIGLVCTYVLLTQDNFIGAVTKQLPLCW